MKRIFALAQLAAICLCLAMAVGCEEEETSTTATPSATAPEATPESPQPASPGPEGQTKQQALARQRSHRSKHAAGVGEPLSIDLLDHIVLGQRRLVSLNEQGLL